MNLKGINLLDNQLKKKGIIRIILSLFSSKTFRKLLSKACTEFLLITYCYRYSILKSILIGFLTIIKYNADIIELK